MITLDNIYDFYKMTDENAEQLVGQVIEEAERVKQKPSAKRNNPQPPKKWAVYFPISLNNPNFNYGKKCGLIGVSNVFDHYQHHTPYFRVYAMSPDDLDLGITYEGEKAHELRQKVYDFMLSLPFENTSYKEVLELVVDHVGCGEIGL